jgi:hypothetical protein
VDPLRLLLKKELTVTDVGELGRIILPKVLEPLFPSPTNLLLFPKFLLIFCRFLFTYFLKEIPLFNFFVGLFRWLRETQSVSCRIWTARKGSCSVWRTTTLTNIGHFGSSTSPDQFLDLIWSGDVLFRLNSKRT